MPNSPEAPTIADSLREIAHECYFQSTAFLLTGLCHLKNDDLKLIQAAFVGSNFEGKVVGNTRLIPKIDDDGYFGGDFDIVFEDQSSLPVEVLVLRDGVTLLFREAKADGTLPSSAANPAPSVEPRSSPVVPNLGEVAERTAEILTTGGLKALAEFQDCVSVSLEGKRALWTGTVNGPWGVSLFRDQEAGEIDPLNEQLDDELSDTATPEELAKFILGIIAKIADADKRAIGEAQNPSQH